MKTAPAFNIYLLGSLEHLGLKEVLAEIGMEGTRLEDTTTIVSPALILLGTGQSAPQGLADISIALPVDASRAALGHLLHMAMENVTLKQQVRQHEEQARRQHRQFEELNRIGIALSAERDIGKLQEFIQLDGATDRWEIETIDIAQPYCAGLERRYGSDKQTPDSKKLRQILIQRRVRSESIERESLCPDLHKLFRVVV